MLQNTKSTSSLDETNSYYLGNRHTRTVLTAPKRL